MLRLPTKATELIILLLLLLLLWFYSQFVGL
jgi:hypothetical protein